MLSLGAMSGYELRRVIDESIGNFWSESFGQIYPTLKQLQAKGLVSASEGARLGSKVYSLTELGHFRFREWLGLPAQPQVVRNELLLKLFFGNHADSETVCQQVTQERHRFEADLAHYAGIEARLKADYGGHPGMPYWLMTVNYGKAEAVALIGWCDETLKQIKTLAAKPAEAVR
jgi:DNA-binding PadR family transcriptional regulator